jgi:hypothetical protein
MRPRCATRLRRRWTPGIRPFGGQRVLAGVADGPFCSPRPLRRHGRAVCTRSRSPLSPLARQIGPAIVEEPADRIHQIDRLIANPTKVSTPAAARSHPSTAARSASLPRRRAGSPGAALVSSPRPHHIVWWGRGGRTDLENLLLVCTFHHKLVHEHGWRLERGQDNSVGGSGPTVVATCPVRHRRARRGLTYDRRSGRVQPSSCSSKRTVTVSPTSLPIALRTSVFTGNL